MDLKNCKIGMLISDPILGRMLYDLLWKNGAVVHCAKDEEEMERFYRLLGFDLAIVELEPEPEPFCRN
jgi:hypothetical protein